MTGLRDMATQQKRLGTKDLTLEKALQIATSLEDAKRQAPTLRSVSSEAPRQVEKLMLEAHHRAVLHEGRRHATTVAARVTVQVLAGTKTKSVRVAKKGHLERVCRSKQKTEQKPPLKPTPKSKPEAKAHNVTAVTLSGIKTMVNIIYLNAINAIGGDTPRITVTPKINGKSITMEVDTGAAVSIISRKTWMGNFKEFPLKAATVVLTTYTHDRVSQ